MTAESYRDVMAARPYRLELDWVVEAPNGEFVARSLSRPVCATALHALHDEGGATAVVSPRGR